LVGGGVTVGVAVIVAVDVAVAVLVAVGVMVTVGVAVGPVGVGVGVGGLVWFGVRVSVRVGVGEDLPGAVDGVLRAVGARRVGVGEDAVGPVVAHPDGPRARQDRPTGAGIGVAVVGLQQPRAVVGQRPTGPRRLLIGLHDLGVAGRARMCRPRKFLGKISWSTWGGSVPRPTLGDHAKPPACGT
jgi:hypothetical protein